MEAASDFESAATVTGGKDGALMVNIQGMEPVYRTVERAFPAYVGLPYRSKPD